MMLAFRVGSRRFPCRLHHLQRNDRPDGRPVVAEEPQHQAKQHRTSFIAWAYWSLGRPPIAAWPL